MLNKILENQAEQIAVNPSQAAFSLANNSKFPTPLEALEATTDTNITNNAINHSLTNNPSWQNYISDPLRFEKPENKIYFGIEALMDDARHYSIADKYGNELTDRARIIFDYAQPDDWWMRTRMGVKYWGVENKLQKARADLSGAIRSDDSSQEEIQSIKDRIQELEFDQQNNAVPFESELANTITQIGVGIAKPLAETMGLIALGALAGTGVGALAGAGYIGAKAVKVAKKAIDVGERVGAAAIVYNDTYRTELGATLRMLDEEHPELSEEQKYDYARPAAVINAAIEAAPSLITKGVEGKVFKGISAIRSASMRAILRSKLPQELSTDPRFLGILTKNIKKKTVKDFVLDAAGTYSVEAATEVIQNSISDSVREVVLNPDLGVLQVASEDLLDFIANPLDPKHAEKWKTAKNVFLGSMLIGESLGGATKAATKIINRAGNRTVGDAISGVRKNQNAAEGLFKWRNTAEVAKASPETVRAHLQNMVDRGDAPSTVYLDKQSAEELMDTDPDVREAFEKLGVLQAIRESETNGGTVEIPLVEYDEVINGDSSGKLYQKVRAMVSFDNNLLSTAEFMRYIQTDANVQGEIAEAQKKADSVYNKTLEIMNTVENMDENTKKMNATIMQLITNRIAGFSIGSPKTAEEVFSKVDILTGQAQPIEVRLPSKPVSQGMDTSAYDIQTPKGTTKEQLKGIQKQKQAPSLLRLKDIKSAMKDAGYRNIGAPILSQTAGSESVYAKIYKGEGKDKKAVAKVRISAHPSVSKNPKVASKAARGADGLPIIALDGRKSLEENIATLNEELNKLRIEPDDIAAGWFTKESDRLIIALTKETNATAFAHEAFHLFADSLIESYNADTLSPYWKGQAEKMFKSVGVKVKNGKAKLTNAQQETLAQDFTTYILQGKVKNQELTSLFAVMKDLFSKLYTKFGWNKSKQLDKNIRDVFNSIFNSQAEIEAEQRALGMLEFKKPEAADQALYDRYLDFLFKGRAKASTKMALAIKRYEAFKGSSEYISLYAKEYDKASETLRSSLAYRILEIGATVGNDPVATFTAVVNEVQDEDLAITVDFVKDVLDNTPPLEEEARRIAEEAMTDYVLEEFGLNKESFASAAIRTADKAKALFAEALLREGKTWAEFESEYSNLLKGVEAQTARMKLSKIRNVDYWNTQEVRLVEQYMYYMATGDMRRAAEVRRSHAALTLIRLKGQEIDKRTQRFKSKFPDKMRFNQKGKAVSATSWELMQSILERYGFKISSKRRDPRPVNIKLDKWIAERESTEYTVVGNVRYFIPDILKGHIGKFSQMDVRTFEIMENVLNAIYSLAKEENSMVREGRKIFFDKLVDETYEHMDKKGIEPFEEKKGWWAKHLGTIADWTNPEPILEAIFPESVLNALFRPLFTAAAKAENVAKEWSDRWAVIKSKVNLSNDKKTYANGVRLSNFEVADLLLSMGTRHAYDNFLLKYKITDLQAEIVMSEALEEHPELEKFAKDTWALYEETTDALNKSYERRTNQLFVKKEHRQFDINGIRFEGGYVPENKGYPTIPNDASYNSIMMAMLSNEKMLAREADGEVRSIIDNTDSRLYLFARWAYVAESYNNVCRFMKRDAVRARIGIRADKFIKDWLISYQTPQTDASGLIRPLVSATSVAALGFRLSTALLQLSGIFPAAKVVGWKNLVRGIRRSMVDADMFGAIKKAADKSEYMKSRYDNPVSSLMGIDSKDLGNVEWLRKNYQKKAMLLISYCDALVSNAVWDAAYIKATEQQGLSHEEAILSADAAVRISQSDSMSLSRSKALQSSWARLVTPYSTYIMGMQSLVRGKIASNEKAYAAAFAMSYIVISTFYEAMLKEAINGSDEEDDDKYLERVFKTWYNQGVGTFGNTVIPGLNIGGGFASALFSGVEKALRDGDEEMWTKHYAPTVSAFNYLGQVSSIVYNVPSAIVGDEDAQIKVGLSFVGLFSQRGKKALKEWMNE